jgi:choline/glycine/proline betaine transport protein
MRDHQEPPVEEREWFHLDVHPWVFFTSALLIVFFVAITLIFDQVLGNAFGAIQAAISEYAGWLYIWTINIVLIFVLVLLVSRFGDIRLGGPDARPEFSTKSWFAMLFSAGMGIGLLFFGVAEPMFHYAENPFTETGTSEAARMAMDITFLHWGFHPWAIYTLVGLSLAFFSFNMGLPLSIRTAFYPLIGERIYGPIGNAIDILATVATLFGVATSLGIGVQQVNAGLHHVFGLPQSATVQVALIAGITLIATWSVVRGLDKGIRFLSEVNIVVAGSLALFVFVMGPTLFILDALLENIGFYVQNLPSLATWREVYEQTEWQQGWTIFYWAWWISWSPFVGMFIARVSYGRTIRTFIAGVLLVPTLVTFLWMTIFGNTALYIEMFGGGGIVAAVQENIPVSLFVLFEHFPLASVSSVLGIAVIVTFFVTSSDSGSMVIDIITSGGNPDPPVLSRLFWAILEGVVAATLLAGGGLVALQTATITTGLPFALVLLGMCVALWKGLSDYVSPQAFTLEAEGESEEMRIKHKAPLTKTFGRRRLW